MESNSYSACESSASSKIAESNRESAHIVDPLQHDHTNLARVLGHTDNAMSKASADARLDSLKGHKSQNSQPPKEVVVEGPWANAVDPHDWLPFFLPVDTDAGDISDRNVYRSMTPTDTPELSMSGSSEPNSDISEGVFLSINVDIFNDKWQLFGGVEVDGLFDLNDLNNAEYDSIESRRNTVDGKQPALNSSSLDDVGDTSAFPFDLDISMFSMASPPTQEFDLEDFNLFGNSPFETVWYQSKIDPIHPGCVSVDQKSADDVVEVPNPNTLPSRIFQEATLPSGSPTISGTQRSSSVCSGGSVGFDTDSTWSGEESDWEDEDIDPNELLAQTIHDSEVAVRPLLTPIKRELVNGIMKEFWVIFSQEWSANIRNRSGTPNSTSSSISQNKGETGNEPNKDNRGQKRQRNNDGGDEDFGGDGKRDPKRPRIESPPNVSQERRKFACPYRKHDPRTYCHRIRCWRPCALTPLETIARVKGHLYRYHRIFQCLRCKVLQTNEDELKKHVLEVKGCEVKEGRPVEGITSDIEKQLKSRKKTHRNQTEAERWQEMYRILFPMEEVPSPYFEAIQDNIMRSPESEELTSYEEYSRRELPRLFRDALEAAIADEAQPIEERLRSQLVGMIQDCQDRVFSAYRSRRSFDSPSSNHVVARSPLGHPRLSSPVEQAMPNSAEVASTGIVEALYEGAPLQAFHPETDVTDATSKRSTENPPSDSGYISEPSLLSSDSFSVGSMAASQTLPAGNSQQQQSPGTPRPAAENSTEMPSYLHLSFEETRMQTYELPNIPVQELTVDQNIDTGFENFDFEKWMPSIGEGAFQEYWSQWDNLQ